MIEENFNCLICKSNEFDKSEIVILKCKHIYCWSCIGSYIDSQLNSKIKCPCDTCQTFINDSIIRQALSDSRIKDYETISLKSIVNSQDHCFKCLLPECENIVFFNDKEIQFECPICSLFNCIVCEGSHPFTSCKEYQLLKRSSLTNLNDKNMLESIEESEFNRAKIVLQIYKSNQWISEIENLESFDNIPNDESFNCSICFKVVSKGEGVKLRSCYHMFCKNCLHDGIKNTETIPIFCLESSCKSRIEDREIRGILNKQEYQIFHDKCLSIAKSKLSNVFHCKKPDCIYFGILENENIKSFTCPVCQSVNCMNCNIIHKKHETCEEYNNYDKETNLDLKSMQYIEKEVKEGKCMKCPGCGCIIKKSGGCNWIKCPRCRLELCWILKIPRWGPKGSGDTSGGCRCGINNKPCDPKCTLGCIPEH